MKHPYFHKAVAEAYQNILPPETIPSYFIFMEIDPASIDINIHPTKTEIKFEDERAIWQILMASVREALGRFNIVPSFDFEGEGLIDIPVRSVFKNIPDPPAIEIDPQYDPFAGDERISNQNNIIERFERENNSGWEKLYSALEREEPRSAMIDSERRFFQIKNKYIICPVKSGLMIIDQKRAHERILYERFLDNLESNRNISQTELFPVNLELNPADIFVLKEIENEIRLLGFNFRITDNVVSVTGRPSGIGSSDPVIMLEILLEEYKKTQSDPSTGAIEKIASAMAGASAIPYGKVLLKSEMEDLFDTLFSCKSPNYSPKGKPVINILTLEEIDKRLK
jgi:DNA mismatch repair protein MutL